MKNKQNVPFSDTLTAEQRDRRERIMEIRDAAERQRQIAQHIDLFIPVHGNVTED